MKKELLVIMLANILSAIGMGIFAPVYLLYYQKIGNYSEIATAFGIFWIVLALLEVPFGYLSDRFGKKYFIVIGGILTSLVSFCFIFVKSAFELYFLEFLSGMATSMQTPAVQSLISEVAPRDKRGKFFGLFNSSTNFTYGLASIVSGIFIGVFGLTSIFIISSFFQISSVFLASRIKS
ncbi:MAG: MFS transporter [Candidatus Aenigmatarchaeota archaeon]